MNYKLTCLGIMVILLFVSIVTAQSGQSNAGTHIKGYEKPIIIGYQDNNESGIQISPPSQSATPMEKESYYRQQLDIGAGIPISSSSVDAFVSESAIEPESVAEAVVVSKLVQPVGREKITTDILSMNKQFVKRFAVKAKEESTKQEIQQQVESYNQDLENRNRIQIQIDMNQVKDLFDKKITIESFLSSIWRT